MEILWTTTNGKAATASLPYNVEEFASVIGIEATAELCLHLGGSLVYLPRISRPNSLLRSVISEEQVLALSDALFPGVIRIPIANSFLARFYRSQGLNLQQIARRIRIDARSVRRVLNVRSYTD